MKQSKLRKRRVVRFAILYFFMFVIFLALIIGPVFASKYLGKMPKIQIGTMDLLQPTGQNNNDTSGERTGSALVNVGGPAAATGSGAAASGSAAASTS